MFIFVSAEVGQRETFKSIEWLGIIEKMAIRFCKSGRKIIFDGM